MPVFVILMHNPTKTMLCMAVLVFIVAALTDSLDGIIARKYGAVSDFGKLVDPLADKLLVMAALVMLVAQKDEIYGDPWVPAWMVVVVLAREIWVTGLRAVAAADGRIMEAGSAGKVKSMLQMLAIILLLLHNVRFRFAGIVVSCEILGLYVLFVSVAFSCWSAFEYTRAVFYNPTKSNPVSPG